MRTAWIAGIVAGGVFVSSFASAQEPPPAGTGTGTGTGTATGSASATVDTTAPPVVVKRETKVEVADAKGDAVPDHEQVVGKFAVGYLGVTQLPIGTGAANAVARGSVDAPVIGVRYWLNPKLGIDAGLGFGFKSSGRAVEQNNTTTETDLPTAWGVALHGGVPLVFGYGKHYKFLAVPELTVGLAHQTDKLNGNPAPPDINRSGFRLDVGGRIGTEIQFGFIGIPQLALQASVGLFFRRQVWKNSQDTNPAQSSSEGETTLSTSVQSDPWALFVNNISAFYYFP